MIARFALSLLLACAAGVSAQQTIPQLDKSKPPTRPLTAPEREKIDPKDYPRYTAATFIDGPVAKWRAQVKPEIVEGNPKQMKDPKTNANWQNKYTLKYEWTTDANKKTVGHGYSRATWNSTGKLYCEGTWRNDQWHGVWKKSGPWTTYHLDGKTPQREANYGADEKYDGPLVDYYANGKIQQKGKYIAGKQEGEWESYYDDGGKRWIVNYKSGHLEGLYRTWHANGQQSAEYAYKNGDYDGSYQTWHENGQLEVQGTFKDNHPVGPWRAWYASGKPESEKHYDEKGEPTGKWTEWAEDGTVTSEEDHG